MSAPSPSASASMTSTSEVPVLRGMSAGAITSEPQTRAGAPAPAGPPSLTRIASTLADATVQLLPGAWDPELSVMTTPDAFVLVVTDGLVLREVLIHGVPTAQFVIPGDTVVPSVADESPLCGEIVSWRVVEPTRVAVLGRGFLAAAQRQPRLLVALQRRQAAQLRRAARYAAIVHLPRVEQRVLTLMCALAEERGHVAADGIILRLDLTHEHLGRLVGARRPTVSLALKALADQDLLRRRGSEWLIARRATHFAVSGELTP